MTKKLFQYLIVTIMAAVALPSCNKDSKDEPNDVISKEQLAGTWESRQVLAGGQWVDTSTDSSLAFTATFYADGRYHGSGSVAEGWGTYVIKGDQVNVLYEGAVLLTYKIQSLNGNNAQVSITKGATVTTAVITKTSGSTIVPGKPEA